MSELTLACMKCGHPLPAEMRFEIFIVFVHGTTCPMCETRYTLLEETMKVLFPIRGAS